EHDRAKDVCFVGEVREAIGARLALEFVTGTVAFGGEKFGDPLAETGEEMSGHEFFEDGIAGVVELTIESGHERSPSSRGGGESVAPRSSLGTTRPANELPRSADESRPAGRSAHRT